MLTGMHLPEEEPNEGITQPAVLVREALYLGDA
jgi:hypothetical protein